MRIRAIEPDDQAAIVNLLVEGFPSRDAAYWVRAFEKLALQKAPAGQPQFGLAMQEGAEIVGVLLNIWTPSEALPEGHIRANLSSWYVRPQFRSFAAMMLAKACRNAMITYLNVSAAENTIQICEAIGFKRYTKGQSLCVPLLSYDQNTARVCQIGKEKAELEPRHKALMEAHVAMGCLGLVGEVDGTAVPFLFVRRRVQGWIPAYQLVYCTSLDVFRRCARGIGVQLLRRGVVAVICDGTEKIGGMPAKFFNGKVQKYYKGPDEPAICDLSFTEIPLFGI